MAGSLWRHPAFRRLWTARTISSLGSQITFVALPLTAVLMLEATPRQMGILTAAGTLPYLLVGLPAGAWVDRLPRRPVMIAADLGRVLLLTTVPLAALFQLLSIGQLYFVAFLTGVCTMAYDVAEEAFLPSVIDRERLIEGNSKFASVDAVVTIAGPGLGGGLVQLLTAPIAVAVDVLSYLVSATLLSFVRVTESAVRRPESDTSLWYEIRVGLRFLFGQPLLRAIVATSATMQLFGGMFNALLAIYIARELGLPPAALGLMYAVGSASGFVGAIAGERIAAKLGIGRVIVLSAAAIGAGWCVVSLAGGAPGVAFAIIAAGMLLAGLGNTLYNVNTTSLAQSVTPNRVLGRVNASRLFVGWGALPLGSLLGGFLGEAVGIRRTLLLAGLGLGTGFLWVLFSPVRRRVSIES